MKCQLRENLLPFVSCHSWLPNFLRCLQFAWETRAARQLDQKKNPSLLLYYLAQYIITVLGNCITFKCALCIVYYGENKAFWILPIWLAIMHFRCTETVEILNWIWIQHPGRCRSHRHNFEGWGIILGAYICNIPRRQLQKPESGGRRKAWPTCAPPLRSTGHQLPWQAFPMSGWV